MIIFSNKLLIWNLAVFDVCLLFFILTMLIRVKDQLLGIMKQLHWIKITFVMPLVYLFTSRTQTNPSPLSGGNVNFIHSCLIQFFLIFIYIITLKNKLCFKPQVWMFIIWSIMMMDWISEWWLECSEWHTWRARSLTLRILV